MDSHFDYQYAQKGKKSKKSVHKCGKKFFSWPPAQINAKNIFWLLITLVTFFVCLLMCEIRAFAYSSLLIILLSNAVPS
jgi:hypothetical protein